MTALKTVLRQVDKSNMFLQQHVPPLHENQKKYNKALRKLMKSDQSYNGLIMHFKKELDELTTVWAQEEEKTSMMQKLLSSLFEEVHDMESH